MENFDSSREQQVWQRVLGDPEPVPSDLRELRREAMELAAAYRSLSGMLTGSAKEQAKQLYEGEKANIACLKGIDLLSRRKEETLKLWNPAKEPAEKILEKCYHRTRRCRMEYMARSAETEFGAVFQKMADREGAQCARITELLGSMK